MQISRDTRLLLPLSLALVGVGVAVARRCSPESDYSGLVPHRSSGRQSGVSPEPREPQRGIDDARASTLAKGELFEPGNATLRSEVGARQHAAARQRLEEFQVTFLARHEAIADRARGILQDLASNRPVDLFQLSELDIPAQFELRRHFYTGVSGDEVAVRILELPASFESNELPTEVIVERITLLDQGVASAVGIERLRVPRSLNLSDDGLENLDAQLETLDFPTEAEIRDLPHHQMLQFDANREPFYLKSSWVAESPDQSGRRASAVAVDYRHDRTFFWRAVNEPIATAPWVARRGSGGEPVFIEMTLSDATLIREHYVEGSVATGDFREWQLFYNDGQIDRVDEIQFVERGGQRSKAVVKSHSEGDHAR